VITKLTEQAFDTREIGWLTHERLGDLGFERAFATPHGFREPLDGFTPTGTPSFRQCLAPLQDFHEQRGIGARPVRFVRGASVTGKERRGARYGIAQRPERFVDFDGTAECPLALARGPPGITIGVQDARQIAVALLEEIHVEVESGLDLEENKRIGQRFSPLAAHFTWKE
jgi:hypothetical protein